MQIVLIDKRRFFLKLIKIGLLLSPLILLPTIFSSCQRQTAIENEAILRLALPPEEIDSWRELCNIFEKEHPGAHIELTEAPKAAGARETLITTSLLSGEAADDLFYLDIIWTPKFAAAGWLEDLSDLLDEDNWRDFLVGDLAASRYRSRIYRLPVRSDAGLLYYRKDLLAQAGLT